MTIQFGIEGKLVQALMVWKEQGGPDRINISEATDIVAEKNPGMSESQMKSIVSSSTLLELEGSDIVLNSALTELM